MLRGASLGIRGVGQLGSLLCSPRSISRAPGRPVRTPKTQYRLKEVEGITLYVSGMYPLSSIKLVDFFLLRRGLGCLGAN